MKGQIRVSTAVLLCVIAVLVGALVVTFGTQRAPFVPSAQAATYEQGPLVTFAPVLKRAMPAVVNISSSKVVKNRANSDARHV
jgi:S1-C subfamily serine protease